MLQPFISHQFKSSVWRLEIDSLTDTIFAEVRSQGDKKVTFSSIGLNNAKVYFDNIETEERWLTGVEAAYDGVLILHNYLSDSGPAHKGLIAIDGFSVKALWSDFNYALDFLSINGPVVFDTRLQPRRLSLIDIKTGAIIRKYEPAIDLEITVPICLPAPAELELTPAFHLPVSPLQNSVRYLDHNNLRIVSLHALTDGILRQHLYVMKNIEIIYEDLLNTDIQKLQPESFLLHKDQLIYLKNQSQLKVLNL